MALILRAWKKSEKKAGGDGGIRDRFRVGFHYNPSSKCQGKKLISKNKNISQTTLIKKNRIFLIYEEIQKGSVAKS
jgi:hypothetical protein